MAAQPTDPKRNIPRDPVNLKMRCDPHPNVCQISDYSQWPPAAETRHFRCRFRCLEGALKKTAHLNCFPRFSSRSCQIALLLCDCLSPTGRTTEKPVAEPEEREPVIHTTDEQTNKQTNKATSRGCLGSRDAAAGGLGDSGEAAYSVSGHR